mgnify:CR=1 FL=1
MRRFLENVMYARPREKEFLVGHPSFYLMVAALYRKWPQLLHFFLVIAATIGVGSMVETFAHIRTPFLMSFIRGINGWVTGMVVGIALIIAIAIVRYVTTWLGKQVETVTRVVISGYYALPMPATRPCWRPSSAR